MAGQIRNQTIATAYEFLDISNVSKIPLQLSKCMGQPRFWHEMWPNGERYNTYLISVVPELEQLDRQAQGYIKNQTLDSACSSLYLQRH